MLNGVQDGLRSPLAHGMGFEPRKIFHENLCEILDEAQKPEADSLSSAEDTLGEWALGQQSIEGNHYPSLFR